MIPFFNWRSVHKRNARVGWFIADIKITAESLRTIQVRPPELGRTTELYG